MTDDGTVSPASYDDKSGSGGFVVTDADELRASYVRAGSEAQDLMRGSLADVIARDILPRLLMDHRAAIEPIKSKPVLRFTNADRERYFDLTLRSSADTLARVTQRHIDNGFTLEAILLELMAPVARRLGTLWETDELNIVDVTIGVQRMQYVLREVCKDDERPGAVGLPTALLVPAVAEAHTFGLVMVGELLRRHGWKVTGGLPMPDPELFRLLSRQSFVLIGISVSAEALLPDVASAITRMRASSCNRNVKIIVGGRVFDGKPELAKDIGAEAAFSDAAAAIVYTDSLVLTAASTYVSR